MSARTWSIFAVAALVGFAASPLTAGPIVEMGPSKGGSYEPFVQNWGPEFYANVSAQHDFTQDNLQIIRSAAYYYRHGYEPSLDVSTVARFFDGPSYLTGGKSVIRIRQWPYLIVDNADNPRDTPIDIRVDYKYGLSTTGEWLLGYHAKIWPEVGWTLREVLPTSKRVVFDWKAQTTFPSHYSSVDGLVEDTVAGGFAPGYTILPSASGQGSAYGTLLTGSLELDLYARAGVQLGWRDEEYPILGRSTEPGGFSVPGEVRWQEAQALLDPFVAIDPASGEADQLKVLVMDIDGRFVEQRRLPPIGTPDPTVRRIEVDVPGAEPARGGCVFLIDRDPDASGGATVSFVVAVTGDVPAGGVMTVSEWNDAVGDYVLTLEQTVTDGSQVGVGPVYVDGFQEYRVSLRDRYGVLTGCPFYSVRITTRDVTAPRVEGFIGQITWELDELYPDGVGPMDHRNVLGRGFTAEDFGVYALDDTDPEAEILVFGGTGGSRGDDGLLDGKLVYLGLGTNRIFFIAVDRHGNRSTDRQFMYVTIEDTIAPRIQPCPADTTVQAPWSPTSTVVHREWELYLTDATVDITAPDGNPSGFEAVGVSVMRVATQHDGTVARQPVQAGLAPDPQSLYWFTFPGRFTLDPRIEANVVYEITVHATDWWRQNTSTCSWNVTVEMAEAPPYFTCDDVTVGNEPDACFAFVSFGVTPSVRWTGLAGEKRIVYTAPGGEVVSGDAFMTGITPVTVQGQALADGVWTEVDGATCSFQIKVEDREVPTITGPTEITLVSEGGDVALTAALLGLQVGDNCDTQPLLTLDPTIAPVGITEVTATASDIDGNQSTHAITVTVIAESYDCRLQRPLENTVDNRIQHGRTVPVKLKIYDDNVVVTDAVVALHGVEQVDGRTPIANEVVDDSGQANDEGSVFRFDAGNDCFVYNLSTKPWDATSGARFKVTVRISKEGRADAFCEFHVVNK